MQLQGHQKLVVNRTPGKDEKKNQITNNNYDQIRRLIIKKNPQKINIASDET